MKIELCNLSGYKIYPANGRTFVSKDSKTFHFLNSKCESLFHQKKNARDLAWTPICRKIARKGISEEVAKKRTRRTVKYNRAVVGASWEAINARRTEKPELRAAARAEAVSKAKEKRKGEAAKKKVARANAPQGEKFNKNQPRAATKVSRSGR
ncbi:60S ribosomal protein L24 [Coemansia javaensis]|uniref:60S ribosomal protein L24 n=1 Tax=Coemansia javaensis TaxID=2761396 RepID=A0A9W8HCH6_9FUNG|nr:60S ribosomal protein L24 [Coemansia javaensis]